MYDIFKRVIDVTLASLGLVLLSPLLLVVAMRIRADSPGPVLYRGLRAGKDGRPFGMLKFRTMVMDADRLGGPSTAADDWRLTRVGKSLRRYKLDELPQLWNVVCGEMSLVGPRPEVIAEVAEYTAEERQLLTVRPGITDWASIRFRDEGEILSGSPDPHQTYRERIRPEKVRLGLEYVRRRSLATDMRILARTARVVLK